MSSHVHLASSVPIEADEPPLYMVEKLRNLMLDRPEKGTRIPLSSAVTDDGYGVEAHMMLEELLADTERQEMLGMEYAANDRGLTYCFDNLAAANECAARTWAGMVRNDTDSVLDTAPEVFRTNTGGKACYERERRFCMNPGAARPYTVLSYTTCRVVRHDSDGEVEDDDDDN